MRAKEHFQILPARKRRGYLPPVIEIIEMENEGIIATSIEPIDDGGTIGGNASTHGNYVNYSSTSDLENMINDVLTFEK